MTPHVFIKTDCSMATTRRITILATFCLGIMGCGGSSGMSGEATIPTDSTPSGISGTVLATSSDTTDFGIVYAIDAATGRGSVEHLARNRREDSERYDLFADFMVGRPQPGLGPIIGINECVPNQPSDPLFARRASCLEAIGSDGQFERLFTLDRELIDRPSQSPDGNLIAVVTSLPSDDPSRPLGDQTLELFTRTGELAESILIDLNRASSPYIHEWTSDNRLVYAFRRANEATFITVTEPHSVAIAESYLISDNGIGNVRTLAISPDDNLIAYDLVFPDENPATRTFVLTRGTGTSRLLAQSADDRLVSTPEWSPDGSQIMVTNAASGFFSALFGLGIGPSHKMIVRTDSDEPVFINANTGDGVIFDPQEVVGDFGDSGFETEFNDRFESWFYEDRVFWK